MTNGDMDPAVVSNCYSRSLDSTIHFVRNVTDDAWKNDTPCSDWSVKDVVNHIVYENFWMVALFNGRTIAEVGDEFDGDLVGEDPIGVYISTALDVKETLAEPDAMERIVGISSGDVTGAEYAKQLFLDTLIHGWDIAVGSKQDATLDPYLVEMCMPLGQAIANDEGYRSAFAEATDITSRASPQTKLLALLGREG